MFEFIKQLWKRHESYCVACRRKRPVTSVSYNTVGEGASARRVLVGKCSECGSKTSNFVTV
jgi:hypothetical protein